MAYNGNNGPTGPQPMHRSPQTAVPFLAMNHDAQQQKQIRVPHDSLLGVNLHDPMKRRTTSEEPAMNGNAYDVPLMELARENIVLKHQLHTAQLEVERLKSMVVAREAVVKEEDSTSQPRYWTDEEHERFLEALEKFGHKDVKAIANYVETRNATQVRSHAQKYFMKLAREGKLSDDHAAERSTTDGSEGGNTGSSSGEAYDGNGASKMRRVEGSRAPKREETESATSLSSGSMRSNLGGGWQPQGDNADSCSSTSGTSGTNMEDFFDNGGSDPVVGWHEEPAAGPRKQKALRSADARLSISKCAF